MSSAPAQDWAWWHPVRDADPQRQPARPSVMVAGADLFECADLADLARTVAGLLQGRRAVLVRSVATFEGYDTFPAFSVHARATGAETQVPAATYVACVAVQKVRADELLAAIEGAQAAGVGSGGPEGPTTAGPAKIEDRTT